MAKLTKNDILSLVRNTGEGMIYLPIKGKVWRCEWVEQNESGESDCYYVYDMSNPELFAYAVDWSNPDKYPNNDYLCIEEAAE